MGQKYFSRKTGGFYDAGIHGPKGAEGSLVPADAIEVADEAHSGLLAEQADGKRILAGVGGAPAATIPVPSGEEIVAALRARRDRDLAASDWTQLGDNGLTTEQRQAWADYRQQLRDYVALVEAAIAADQDPYAVAYPTPPAIEAPPPPAGSGSRPREIDRV